MSEYQLYLGDCLDILPTLEEQSVDAILTDIPYGTTACKWDVIIPLDVMWREVKRVCRGAFVTTATQPFGSMLISSNFDWFKYDWVWNKKMVSNFGNVKTQPLRQHENVLVFSKNRNTYNPQKTGNAKSPVGKYVQTQSPHFVGYGGNVKHGIGYPKTILEFPRPNNWSGGGLHPTQKPVALYEYLVKTYTNEGDTVLDFCMGSGTTGVAALKLGRKFIGIEKEPKYFAIAAQRITDALKEVESA